jgi:hypothetical protein
MCIGRQNDRDTGATGVFITVVANPRVTTGVEVSMLRDVDCGTSLSRNDKSPVAFPTACAGAARQVTIGRNVYE